MITYSVNELKAKEVVPGFFGKFIHSENMTIAYWDITAGSLLPQHNHFHEQVVNLMEGTLELTVEGETQQLTPGSIVVLPPQVPHSGKAITSCKVIDIFYPAREDYR